MPLVSPAAAAVTAAATIVALLAPAAPAAAQSAPQDLATDAATIEATSPRPVEEPGWFHHWRATIDYLQREGPLVDATLAHAGDTESEQITLGMEAGIGQRGFGRIEGGFSFSESERTLRFDDMLGNYDRRFIGGSAGIFVFPFFAVGAQARYGAGEEENVLTNRAIGDVTRTTRDDEEWRVAPFGLLTAPVGPVQLSLLGGYVHIESETDYSDPTLPDGDEASMDLWVVDFGADWHITPKLRLGANVGWTEITDQDTFTGAVPLDEDWGSVDGHLGYQLFDGFEIVVRGGSDFNNSQGNTTRIGGGISYRF